MLMGKSMGRSFSQNKKRSDLLEQFKNGNWAGMSNAQIGKQLGVAVITICRFRRELGMKKTDWVHRHHVKDNPKKMRFLKEHYRKYTDEEMAKRLGMGVYGLVRLRHALGLYRDKKDVWKIHPHPRGFLGGTHNKKARRKIALNFKNAWGDPNHKFNSEEHRQMLSDRSSKMWAGGRKHKFQYSRARGGKREDLGDIYFRSMWEANIARYLNFLKKNGEIDSWEYEPDTFWFHEIKRGCRSYCPDFKVIEKGQTYYIEVKGWFDQKSKTKLNRMRIYYPHVELRIFDKDVYYGIHKNFSQIIPFWESDKAKSKQAEQGTTVEVIEC